MRWLLQRWLTRGCSQAESLSQHLVPVFSVRAMFQCFSTVLLFLLNKPHFWHFNFLTLPFIFVTKFSSIYDLISSCISPEIIVLSLWKLLKLNERTSLTDQWPDTRPELYWILPSNSHSLPQSPDEQETSDWASPPSG